MVIGYTAVLRSRMTKLTVALSAALAEYFSLRLFG